MQYTTHFAQRARGEHFKIVVNAENMTWLSDPPGHELLKPYAAYFSCGGVVGSGRTFEVRPDGTVLAVR